MSNIYFTSDLHLGHDRMVPFRAETHNMKIRNVEHMNNIIVNSWNSVVKHRDTVYVLGDVVWGRRGENLHYMHQLNGVKHLILGNHDDSPIEKYAQHFASIRGLYKKYGVIMSHCPLHPQESIESTYRNWKINVHGHIHHKDRQIKGKGYINVNVDVRDFLPVSLAQIREEIKHENN